MPYNDCCKKPGGGGIPTCRPMCRRSLSGRSEGSPLPHAGKFVRDGFNGITFDGSTDEWVYYIGNAGKYYTLFLTVITNQNGKSEVAFITHNL